MWKTSVIICGQNRKEEGERECGKETRWKKWDEEREREIEREIERERKRERERVFLFVWLVYNILVNY